MDLTKARGGNSNEDGPPGVSLRKGASAPDLTKRSNPAPDAAGSESTYRAAPLGANQPGMSAPPDPEPHQQVSLGTPAPGRTAGQRTSRKVPNAVWAAFLAVILLIAGVVLSNNGGEHPEAERLTPPVNGSSSAPSASQPEPSSSISTGSGPAAPSRASTPTRTQPPTVSPAGVDISAVRLHPKITAVSDLFDRYLTATNDHDSTGLLEIFDPAGVTKSDSADGVAKWESEVATTRDDSMRINQIREDPQTPGGLLVHVRFRSRQEASLGPNGQPCTKWSLTFRLTPYGNAFRVLGAQDVVADPC